MADFVAVIRKAVDGLANNTPDTRSKVYEKARSAVVRQLENMKPRPPEELLNRQISKLDAAIAEVESEFAEALPALEDDEGDILPVEGSPYAEDYQEEIEEAQPELRTVDPEPAQPIEEPAEQQHYAEEADEQPVAHVPQEDAYSSYEPEQPSVEPTVEQEPDHEHSHRGWEGSDDPSVQETKPAVTNEHYPEQEHAHANWIGSDDINQHEPLTSAATTENLYAGQWTQHSAPSDAADHSETIEKTGSYETGYTSAQQYDQDVQVEISEPRFDQLPDDRLAMDAAADDIFGTADHHTSLAAENDRSATTTNTGANAAATAVAGAQSAAGADEFARYFDEAIEKTPFSQDNATSLPRADADPFANQSESGKRDAWDDLEDLIGYDSRKTTEGSVADNDGMLRGDSGNTIPPNVYVTPKKSRTKGMLIGAAVAVILGGGAYALYENRSALNDVVGGLTESAQTAAPSNSAAKVDGTPTPDNTTPTATNDPNNGETTGTKFTQRLLANGTEKDEGPAPVSNAQAATAEGVSKTDQNEPPASQATTQGAGTPAIEPPPAVPTTPTTPATQTPAVAESGERIFLYEETLGQSMANAIPGTVAWSLVNETEPDGKVLPTVQAQLSIPDRGISALITFKKNTDASLPASHIVEFVFSTGPGFDGGAIDSVQRMSMKRTEQDHGNALIAVPAKITDDFHMVALNDFPDALKTNLELLRTRDWIDIPLSYRNGRRALMTLQKGAAGKQAFDTAIREWQAAAPAAQ